MKDFMLLILGVISQAILIIGTGLFALGLINLQIGAAALGLAGMILGWIGTVKVYRLL
jgi:hypothetical protein